FAAEDHRGRAVAHGRQDAVGKPAACLARRAQPALARVERNAHALLRPDPVGEEWTEGRRRFLQPDEALLRDDAGLEQMERASRHFWAHRSRAHKQAARPRARVTWG